MWCSLLLKTTNKRCKHVLFLGFVFKATKVHVVSPSLSLKSKEEVYTCGLFFFKTTKIHVVNMCLFFVVVLDPQRKGVSMWLFLGFSLKLQRTKVSMWFALERGGCKNPGMLLPRPGQLSFFGFPRPVFCKKTPRQRTRRRQRIEPTRRQVTEVFSRVCLFMCLLCKKSLLDQSVRNRHPGCLLWKSKVLKKNHLQLFSHEASSTCRRSD